MNKTRLDFNKTHQFSTSFLDYISGKNTLKEFYGERPKIENFEKVLSQRQFPSENRNTLVKALTAQYESIACTPAVASNIASLANEKTFTVTTGHQLNIFTGPLYFIYKIISTLTTTKLLNEKYPKYHFVPIFWMASEDHDLEEINHFFLHNTTHTWHANQGGAVGRMNPKGISEIIDKIPNLPSLFTDAYLGQSTLADACRYYLHALFGAYGLVAIDADSPILKASFADIAEQDLHLNLKEKVDLQSEKLEKLGYTTQIHAREINLFWLENQTRRRIVKTRDGYGLADSQVRFSADSLFDLLQKNPERFSPNVVLRPVYQECILPNLAYIGGPSEIVYWLQLKLLFESLHIPFPILLPRNFALIFSKKLKNKIDTLHLNIADFFLPLSKIEKIWIEKNILKDFSIHAQLGELESVFSQINNAFQTKDPTLLSHLNAIHTKTQNRLLAAEKKLYRSIKKSERQKIKQIRSVKEQLFPEGILQERKTNFLEFSMQDPAFLSKLIDSLDPFDFRIHLLTLD